MSQPSAASFKRNVYILSFVFFCVFTAFSTIQNLEASVVKQGCKSCDVTCWDGSDDCRVTEDDKLPKNQDLVCSWTNSTGTKFCAKFGGKCKSTCPNTLGGWEVKVPEDHKEIEPEFKECGASSNVGSIAIAILYATFTVCCLFGPYVVEFLGAKWSIVGGFLIFTFFCAANFLVAQYPESVALQWGLLVPSSAAVGFAASFLWTAQGAYVTLNANKYAAALNMDDKAVLGAFYGIFFASFQGTQISGNLAASLLLSKANWSTSALMLFYLCFAGVGTVAAFIMIPNVRDDIDDSGSAISDGSSVISVKRPLRETLFGMTTLWKDRKMQLLVPLIMYTGCEQGFIWGTFTSNWVTKSMGVGNVGYVMAAFGAADVLGSFFLGRASDVIGRFPIVTFGAICQLFVIIYLKEMDISECTENWVPMLLSASLWGLGDAVWNTQISCVLGEIFVERKEDAFSNLKFWQSLATSVMFFLNFNSSYVLPTPPHTRMPPHPHSCYRLLSQNDTLYIVLGVLVAGYGCFFIAHFTVGLSLSEEVRTADSPHPLSSRSSSLSSQSPADSTHSATTRISQEAKLLANEDANEE